ncbi:MAG: radical SAM protein [Candidatus Hodarchaeota archaeon]
MEDLSQKYSTEKACLTKVRVSLGTAVVLGLHEGLLMVPPTTGYILLSSSDGCLGACGFCPQAQSSHCNPDQLSRVAWPSFSLLETARAIGKAWRNKKLYRVCIQTTNYDNYLDDLLELVRTIHNSAAIPISISSLPLSKDEFKALKGAGVQRIGIALDAATPELFSEVKGIKAGGPYRWKTHLSALSDAQEVFGKNRVTTHLIIGLGETEKQACEFIQHSIDQGIRVGLFAFTPIPGTRFESKKPPKLDAYRRIQLARALIHEKHAKVEDFEFNEIEQISSFGITWTDVRDLVTSGRPFQTTGCSACNRPFYNESVRGPWYNFPRRLTADEVSDILQDLMKQELF